MIEGTTVTVSVDAEDDVAVVAVDLLVDGEVVATDLAAPYEFNISIPINVGSVVLGATAIDLGSNIGEAQDVVINNLMDHTYYAVIRVQQEGEMIEIDSRPSDAIALSVHYDPPLPIYVEDTVLGEVAS